MTAPNSTAGTLYLVLIRAIYYNFDGHDSSAKIWPVHTVAMSEAEAEAAARNWTRDQRLAGRAYRSPDELATLHIMQVSKVDTIGWIPK
jgi:hypothetical protein